MHEILLAVVVTLQFIIVVMQWAKYRHQRMIEERINRMERILDIADSVLFNQKRFLPMMTAIGDIHEAVCGKSQLADALRAEPGR